MKRRALFPFLFFLPFLFLYSINKLHAQGESVPQDTSTMNYLPLAVGNVWVYYGDGYLGFFCGNHATWYDRYEITGTTQINGKTYFVFSHTTVILNGTCARSSRLFQSDLPIRVDSLNLNIYKSTDCGSSIELLVDSLKSRLYDSISTCTFQGNRVVCSDTSLNNICGSSRPTKQFSTGCFECFSSQRYAKNIGLVFYQWYYGDSYYISLRGAVINGTVCGDTSLTGITPISTEIPSTFKLYQNYPNPFNPVTKIRFDLPASSLYERGAGGFVSLKIYDILGHEIAVLVSSPWGTLGGATYEVEWDATNYPSGVYYYHLTAGDYSPQGVLWTETKRMGLIK